jgi:hypothetical protein
VIVACFGTVLSACESGGVGDPCIPEDEYSPDFPGFTKEEVNVEARSYQCETRLCLVANFQGRVSCPYGSDQGQCFIPGSQDTVQAQVKPQLLERRPDEAVHCSCRCAGPDPNANYCECPSGFTCEPLITADPQLGNVQLAGSYCIRQGSERDVRNPANIPPTTCSGNSCGDPRGPFGG